MRGAMTASDLLLHGHLDGSTSAGTLIAVVQSTRVENFSKLSRESSGLQ